MKHVQPIREKNKIEEIKSYLRCNGTRDLLLFTMGINIGLRISDLLKLKVIDVKGKSHVEIKEQKTGKIKRFPLLGNLQSMIDDYIKGKSDNEYLFKSRRGDILYFVSVLYINRPLFATAFPTGTGSGILKFLLTFSGLRSAHS